MLRAPAGGELFVSAERVDEDRRAVRFHGIFAAAYALALVGYSPIAADALESDWHGANGDICLGGACCSPW